MRGAPKVVECIRHEVDCVLRRESVCEACGFAVGPGCGRCASAPGTTVWLNLEDEKLCMPGRMPKSICERGLHVRLRHEQCLVIDLNHVQCFARRFFQRCLWLCIKEVALPALLVWRGMDEYMGKAVSISCPRYGRMHI